MDKHSRGVETRRSTLPWMAVGSIVVVVLVSYYFFAASEARLSENAYGLTKALYAACNLEDTTRLKAIKTHPELAKITSQELAAITAIIELAEQGQWRTAQLDARELLLSQTR